MTMIEKLAKEKTIPEILTRFDNYLLGIRGFSINTIKAYNINLLMFFKFIISYMNLEIELTKINTIVLLRVKKSDIIAFLVYCNFTRDNTAETRQCKLAAIRIFYDWLLRTTPEGYRQLNPTKDIPNIEQIERLPKYLSLDQTKRIQEIFTLENSRFAKRNNAIISTFLSTGARVSELINANLKDINFKNSTLTVIGKGNKERTLYLNETCKEKLSKYIEQRNRSKKIISLNEPLFLNKNGRRLGIDGVENVCEKAYELMGLSNCGYTTHTLRHTAATMIYIYVSQDILLLKKFLGHESIISTQIYTHIYNKQIKEVVDKNPLNDFGKITNREEEAA